MITKENATQEWSVADLNEMYGLSTLFNTSGKVQMDLQHAQDIITMATWWLESQENKQ